MNKYQRKDVKQKDKLKRELARYMHRCNYLESEKKRLEAEVELSSEVIKINEAYMVYCLTKCGKNKISLCLTEVEDVLKKVKEGEIGIGIKTCDDETVMAVVKK